LRPHPDTGENEADDGKRFPSDLSKSGAIKKRQTVSPTSIPRIFQEYFAADLPAEQAAFMRRSQVLTWLTFQGSHHDSCVEKQTELDAVATKDRALARLNAGMQHEPRATRSKLRAPATQSTPPAEGIAALIEEAASHAR